jgi:8-oxo-dGTP pyrophosphatase MutT (NUDIX family)
MQSVAKMFIRQGDQYLFSRKRAPGKPVKDGKLELLGGKIEPGESRVQGLLRELREEERTGILARKAETLPLRAEFLHLHGQDNFIYRMEITPDELDDLEMDDEESYGYEMLGEADISDDPNRFTPKTLKIFRGLGMV